MNGHASKTFILLLTLISLSSAHSTEESIPKVEYYINDYGAAVWSLGGGMDLIAWSSCETFYKLGFWPVFDCRGRLNTVYDREELRQLAAITGEYKPIPPDTPVADQELLFNYLLERDPAIRKGGRLVWLNGYKEYALDSLKRAKSEAILEFLKSVAVIVISLFAFIMASVVLRHFSSYARTKICVSIASFFRWKENLHVQNIAVEEAVRQVTRDSLKESSPKETAVIRRQISEALEKGETEVAKTLISILQKMENDLN